MMHVPVEIGTLDLGFTVDFPNIYFDCDFTSDGSILPAETFHIGSITLSWDPVTLAIPSGLPISGEITFELDRDHTQFVVSGKFSLPGESYSFWASFPYMNPFRLFEPGWSIHPPTLDAAKVQSQINSIPPNRYKTDAGASTLDSAEYTQDVMRGILTFAGASGFLDEMMAFAQELKSALAPHLRARAGAAAAAGETEIVLALAAGGTEAIEQGTSASAGLFFETSGVFGTFGSVAQDMGLIVSFSAGISFLVYWPVPDLMGNTIPALDCFSGYNLFNAGDVDFEVASVGGAIYWPASDPWTVSSNHVCGVGLGVGPGVGLPLNYYKGNSQTLVNVVLGDYVSISSIQPQLGQTTGNTAVIIQGWGFQSASRVTFDGAAGTGTTEQAGRMLTTYTPTHAAGAVDVIVQNSDGRSAIARGGFTYK